MSTVGSFDRTKHLSELGDPLPNGAGGYTSPAARKTAARGNLNIAASFTEHMMDAAFGEQPLISQATPTSQNATGTMTAAQIMNGIITSTSAAAVAATLPLGSALETDLLAAYPSLATLDSFQFSVINTGPNTVTMTTNTGWTLVGTMTVATLVSARFLVRRTAANTYVLYRLA